MRILIVAPFGNGSLADSYAAALTGLGHEIVRLDSGRLHHSCRWYAGNRWLRRVLRRPLWDRMNAIALDAVRRAEPQLVLAFKLPFMHPDTIRQVRAGMRIPIVNYYPDNPYCGAPLDPRKPSTLRADIIASLREYTCVFIWERGLAQRLRRDQVTAAYLPFGADRDFFETRPAARCGSCRQAHDVVFLGHQHTKRRVHIDAIRQHEVALWGAGWGRVHRRFRGRHVIHPAVAFGGDYATIHAGASVALNIPNDLNMPGHNMRTFEIPAAGGVMLSTYTAEQAEFFPEGEAAWYYRDPSELDGLIERLLRDDAARERTRETARQIAREHTYDKRAASMLSEIEG